MANPHDGHRARVRERFFAEGLDHFAPHEVLEYLLFFTIPNGDTNAIAHELIDHFGSLSAVLEASYEELCAVRGVGTTFRWRTPRFCWPSIRSRTAPCVATCGACCPSCRCASAD